MNPDRLIDTAASCLHGLGILSRRFVRARVVLLGLGLLILGLAVADSSSPGYTLSVLAGVPGGPGNTDGTGVNARFDFPQSVAVDSSGNVYVADSNNYTIRKITPAGVVTVFAGAAQQNGNSDGAGAVARFNAPNGIAADASGNVYVADTYNSTIRMITPAGMVTTFAGMAGQNGSSDGTGSVAQFFYPKSIAVDGGGNVVVADTINNTIRKITPAGAVTTLAGTAGQNGSSDGIGAAARFNSPAGIAVDAIGNVFVADTSNSTIRKITPAGVVTTLAGTAGQFGQNDGTGPAAQFNNPQGIAVDSSGNVIVADSSNDTLRKVTPAGVVTTLAGMRGQTGSKDGSGSAALFFDPYGVAVDAGGNVLVADSGNGTLRKITSAGTVTTLAGTASQYGTADGTGSAARFRTPYGIALDGSGNVFVADANNHTIRKVTPTGVVTTFAGTAGQPGTSDGTGTAARFNYPTDVAVDGSGNVYVADTYNDTIRKITPARAVTTLAGTAGQNGSSDGIGAAALFFNPQGIAVDGSGNVFVADTNNSTIRKITAAGVVTTLAGTAGQTGSNSGVGAAALFSYPQGIAVDGSGNVFVADYGNSDIRKITPAGVVTGLAGIPDQPGSSDGDAPLVMFNDPTGVAVDGSGNVFVADSGNSTIREITSAGVVTTVLGQAGVTGLQTGAGPGVINHPPGIAVTADASTIFLSTENEIVQASSSPAPQAATPSFNPAAGIYTSAQSVTIADNTAGAAIYYTTDGSTPTAQSVQYSGPIPVASNETLTAIAFATGYTESTVARATYAINSGGTTTGGTTSGGTTTGGTSGSTTGGTATGGTGGGISGGTSGGGGGGSSSPVTLGFAVLAAMARRRRSRRKA